MRGRQVMTAPAENPNGLTIRELTRDESWAQLDAWCRRCLGIGVQEFAQRYHAGEYDDPDDDPRLMELAMELEFLERNPPLTTA